jgi:epoxyqueuosine reductase QueG
MNISELSGIVKPFGDLRLATAPVSDILEAFPLLSPSLSRGLDTGISVGVRVSGRILGEIVDQPTRLYLHHYRRLNHLLDLVAHTITSRLLSEGFDAVPIPASQTIDWENQLGHLSHKAVAVRAGLGWIGRNNLLVTPEWGSQVRLVTVLTDAEIEGRNILDGDEGCGSCRACIPVCPADAIGETHEEYEKFECLTAMKEMCKRANVGHYICGICVRACDGRRSR